MTSHHRLPEILRDASPFSPTSETTATALPSSTRTARARFVISGLSCGSDVVRLEHRLGRYRGVQDTTVNLVTEKAFITHDPSVTDRQALQEAIEKAGFGARER